MTQRVYLFNEYCVGKIVRLGAHVSVVQWSNAEGTEFTEPVDNNDLEFL